MGLLDAVLDVAKGKSEAGGQNKLLEGVMGMLGSGGAGGLTDLVDKFQKNGLGNIVSSWISTGQNLPVSPQQIQQVLGGTQLQELAQKAGMQPDAAATNLANLLPNVIDKLTPDGKLPEGGLLEQGLSLLKGKFFGS